jgi:hypothetical protein
MKGQIQLLNVKPSECNHSCEINKRIYERTWLNDSILQIRTTASANCIGVHNPRIKLYGPLLSLEFDEFETAPNDTHAAADCNCVFQIVWKIKGLNIKNKFTPLLNGQLESDYQKKHIDDILENYTIETHNSTYAFLRNAIDKNGLRQGIHTLSENNITTFKLFIDGQEQTNR